MRGVSFDEVSELHAVEQINFIALALGKDQAKLLAPVYSPVF
jgi:hypothetical protein